MPLKFTNDEESNSADEGKQAGGGLIYVAGRLPVYLSFARLGEAQKLSQLPGYLPESGKDRVKQGENIIRMRPLPP